MTNKRIKTDFNRAATRYDQHALLQANVAENLVRLAEHDTTANKRILDIGCGTGYVAKTCTAPVLQMDIAPSMCQQATAYGDVIEGDMHAIPLENDSIDLIFSSMTLQWAEPLERVMAEISRILMPGGSAHIAMPLYGTLAELEQSLDHIGELERILTFWHESAIIRTAEKHQLNALQQITAPHIMWHNNVKDALNSIRNVGAANKNSRRNKPLSKSQFSGLIHEYEDHFRTPKGLPATWNIGYFVLEKQP